jgi:hypothetical protein
VEAEANADGGTGSQNAELAYGMLLQPLQMEQQGWLLWYQMCQSEP